MTSCIFCAIQAGTAPSDLVYQDERVVAFMDIHPINPGHLLVVPRQHAAGLAELDAESGAQLFRVAQRLAGALRRSGLPCAGVNLFLADGAVAGQSVFHIHLHVIPRLPGDGAGMRRSLGAGPQTSRPSLAEAAAAIRRADAATENIF